MEIGNYRISNLRSDIGRAGCAVSFMGSSQGKILCNENGMIIDQNHTSIPFLTKYEKTRVLGIRAKQINKGNKPFIEVPENIIDGYF